MKRVLLLLTASLLASCKESPKKAAVWEDPAWQAEQDRKSAHLKSVIALMDEQSRQREEERRHEELLEAIREKK